MMLVSSATMATGMKLFGKIMMDAHDEIYLALKSTRDVKVHGDKNLTSHSCKIP